MQKGVSFTKCGISSGLVHQRRYRKWSFDLVEWRSLLSTNSYPCATNVR